MVDTATTPAGVLRSATDRPPDYRDVLLPAVEATLATGAKVRIVLVFESFDGVSGGAVGQDLKMGIEHLTGWKRIAVVTDVDWMRHLISLFGWMTPGEVRVFPLVERADAVSWAAAPD
jgi:hypothetical protein